MYQLEIARTWHKVYASHLEFYVSGIEAGGYDSESIRETGICELGKWMARKAQAYASSPSFQSLIESHKRFHEVAADMIRLHQDGRSKEAMDMLEGPYKEASRRVLHDLDDMIEESKQTVPAVQMSKTAPFLGSSLFVGVPVLDAQHQALAELVTRLMEIPDAAIDSKQVEEILSQLINLLLQHFQTEEMYMKSRGMPAEAIDAHNAEHDMIVEELVGLQFDAMKHEGIKASELYGRLMQRIVPHLHAHDLKIGAYV